MSIRTFYKYFASKEDLLVAVYETVVAREAVPRLRKRIDKHRDPMLRLRAYIECLTELTAKTGPAVRTLTTYQYRLAESRPADLARAMKPQFDLLVELIDDVARTKPLRRELDVETAARLTHYTVLGAVHGRVLGAEGAFDIPARTIWEFCASAMFSVEFRSRHRVSSSRALGKTMRVIVNREPCEGNAVCMQVAPEVFDVGEDDKARLLIPRR